ncbi:hypothetical protein CEXT_737471 [Caerostris extrusa]|uniref:Uncharacterized protein n=1 Tax=Caerostris extrusa TaxID=172846 RepID=A0AAV4N195_CAEEX|nr:hypothetical protein CEXT_737471 [Caerostris extrusa]
MHNTLLKALSCSAPEIIARCHSGQSQTALQQRTTLADDTRGKINAAPPPPYHPNVIFSEEKPGPAQRIRQRRRLAPPYPCSARLSSKSGVPDTGLIPG